MMLGKDLKKFTQLTKAVT